MTEAAIPKEYQGRIDNPRDWREIVAWVGDLPPMPQVASRAITMVEDPNATAQSLAELLSGDGALAARVLKISNSAMFCRQREITTLNQAVMIIGFKALKGIVVAATLRQMNRKSSPIDRMVWEHAVGTATAANLLCRHLKKRYVEEAFLLGLLHSIGHLVFLSQPTLRPRFKEILEIVKDEQLDYALAEQQLLGFSHPLIGALVAKKWNFPSEICQIILHYRDPLSELSPNVEQDEKTLVLQGAELLAHAAGIGTLEDYPSPIPQLELILEKLSVPSNEISSTIEELTEKAREQFETDSAVYS